MGLNECLRKYGSAAVWRYRYQYRQLYLFEPVDYYRSKRSIDRKQIILHDGQMYDVLWSDRIVGTLLLWFQDISSQRTRSKLDSSTLALAIKIARK